MGEQGRTFMKPRLVLSLVGLSCLAFACFPPCRLPCNLNTPEARQKGEVNYVKAIGRAIQSKKDWIRQNGELEADQADLREFLSEFERLSQNLVYRDLVGGGFLIGTLGFDRTLGTEDDHFEYWPVDRPAHPEVE